MTDFPGEGFAWAMLYQDSRCVLAKTDIGVRRTQLKVYRMLFGRRPNEEMGLS